MIQVQQQRTAVKLQKVTVALKALNINLRRGSQFLGAGVVVIRFRRAATKTEYTNIIEIQSNIRTERYPSEAMWSEMIVMFT